MKINTFYKTNCAKQDSHKTRQTRSCSFETKLNVLSELLYPKGTRIFESIVLKVIQFLFPLFWASHNFFLKRTKNTFHDTDKYFQTWTAKWRRLLKIAKISKRTQYLNANSEQTIGRPYGWRTMNHNPKWHTKKKCVFSSALMWTSVISHVITSSLVKQNCYTSPFSKSIFVKDHLIFVNRLLIFGNSTRTNLL